MYLSVLSGLFLLKFAIGTSRAQVPVAYWFTLIFLFVFSAFRFEVGCDWTGYLNQYGVFSAVPLAALAQHQEPIWVALITLLNTLGLDYPWLNVISSLVFFLGANAMARRQPDRLAFLVLLFPVLILNMPMSGIRQGAAIGVMFFAYVAFIDRSPVKYVLLVLVAAGFHTSAILMLFLAPLVTGRYSRHRIALAILLAGPGLFLASGSDEASLAATRYIDSGTEAFGALFRVLALSASGAFFLIFVSKKWARHFPDDFKLARLGALLMLFALALVPLSTVIGDRLAYYLIPIQAMIFARLPAFTWRHQRAFFVAAPYLFLLLMFVVWSALSFHFDQCYRPYQTWLFGYPPMVRAIF